MSTKIYEAWKSEESIEKLIPKLHRFRTRCQAEAQLSLGRFVHFTKEKDYQFWRADAKKVIDSGLNDPINLVTSVMLFPHKGSTYILGFGVNYLERLSEKRLKIEKALKVKDFAYWDNTDEPEGVPYKEFRQRGKIWDKILKSGKDVPADSAGVTFELITRETIFSIIWNLRTKHYEKTETNS